MERNAFGIIISRGEKTPNTNLNCKELASSVSPDRNI